MKKAKKNRSKFLTAFRRSCYISIIAVLLWVGYLYTGKLLCHIALGQIGELTNTEITAGSIKYMANGSVLFTDLVVQPCSGHASNCDIIRAKRLFASFDKKSLFLLKPSLKSIDVNDFLFNAVYDYDTNWSNLSRLKIKPSSGSLHKAPDIHLGSGMLQYIKIVNGQEEIALSVPVDAEFEADDVSRKKYSFNITTATMSSGYGLSKLQGTWEPGNVTVTGGVASLSVPKFEMAWFISVSAAELKYDNDENYSLNLTIKDMQSLRNNEPNVLDVEVPPFAEKYGFITALQKFLDTYKPKGLIDIDLKMSGNIQELASSTIQGTVHCRDIAFVHSSFPYDIENLIGDINFTQESISFDNLKGKHGNSELSFSGWYRNFEKNREYKVDIKSDNMPLEDDLYQALSSNQKKFWSFFSPDGNVSIDLQIKRNAETGKTTNLKVGLLDVNAAYSEFPYPLKNLTGSLLFGPDKIVVQDAISRDDDIEIVVNGEIFDRQMEIPPYNFIIDVNNFPMDEVLEASLLDGQKEIYQSFQPDGLAEGSIQVSRSKDGDVTYSADLDFRDTTIQMEFLNGPVKNISANAILSPNSAIVKDFSGIYGDMPISLAGQFITKKDQDLCYDIALDLKQVRLDNKELQGLLPDSIKNTVEQFDPNGAADMIIDLKKLNPEEPVDYSVILSCLGNSIFFSDFDYKISGVTGLMKIDSNHVTLKDVTAYLDNNFDQESGKDKVLLNGDIKIENGAMTKAELSISADNIALDEKYLKLLSSENQGVYTSLSPSGSMGVDFDKFIISNDRDGIKTIDFNGEINLANSEFVISDKPAVLDSVLQVKGKYTVEKGFDDCKVIIDNGNLTLFGKNLTELKTEINYDPNHQGWSSEYILADLYGGKTTAQLDLIQQNDSPMEYVVQTAFEDVDLGEFLSDTNDIEIKESKHASGIMSGSLSFSSSVAQNNSRIGSCRIVIENMKVGKMSPFAKLLQVMNLTEPSDYAFDKMFIDSYIKRNGLVVEKLDMSGKSVAFYGSGSINLVNGNVDLSLTARGPRQATDEPDIIQSLTEGLGKAVIRMDVTGDYHNVKVVKKTLPIIEGTLQIFGEPRLEN